MRDAVLIDGTWHYAPETVTLNEEQFRDAIPRLACGNHVAYPRNIQGYGLWQHIQTEYKCPLCAEHTSAMPMRHQDKWHGIYRAVPWEIVRWTISDIYASDMGKPLWNYYLQLWESLVPDAWEDLCVSQNKDGFYDYHSSKTIDSIDFHGSCTYYIRGRDKRGQEYVEAGCDYGNMFDYCDMLTLDSVAADVRHSIDKLHEITRVVTGGEQAR